MLALPHFNCAWMEGDTGYAPQCHILGSSWQLAPDDTDALQEACEDGALEDCQDALCFILSRRRR